MFRKFGKMYILNLLFGWNITWKAYWSTVKKVKGSYTPEEDEIILRHSNGKSQNSFRDFAKERGRGLPGSVEIRHKSLVSSNEFAEIPDILWYKGLLHRFIKLISTNEFEIVCQNKLWQNRTIMWLYYRGGLEICKLAKNYYGLLQRCNRLTFALE